MEKEELLDKVEKLRIKMYELMANKDSLSDMELVNTSKKIDMLLNSYIRDKFNLKN